MRLLWSDQPYQNDVAPVMNLSSNLVSKEGHRWSQNYRKKFVQCVKQGMITEKTFFTKQK